MQTLVPTVRCRLQDAAGRVEACPGAWCPFWAAGGDVLPSVCAVERLQLALTGSPELVQSLLKLRRSLDRGLDGDTRPLFYRLAPPARPSVP